MWGRPYIHAMTRGRPNRVYCLVIRYVYEGAMRVFGQTLLGTRPSIYDLQSCVLGAFWRLISLPSPTYLLTNSIYSAISVHMLILDQKDCKNGQNWPYLGFRFSQKGLHAKPSSFFIFHHFRLKLSGSTQKYSFTDKY